MPSPTWLSLEKNREHKTGYVKFLESTSVGPVSSAVGDLGMAGIDHNVWGVSAGQGASGPPAGRHAERVQERKVLECTKPMAIIPKQPTDIHHHTIIIGLAKQIWVFHKKCTKARVNFLPTQYLLGKFLPCIGASQARS